MCASMRGYIIGYAEDNIYCGDRYKGISSEIKDGKDAFNALNFSQGVFLKERVMTLIMKSYILKEKVKDITVRC